MSDKLKHDATSSIAGTIHQFYVALDYCFSLVSGDTLFIEKFGDITITESKQIEVKKYNDDLTDLHENIWKTINNWLQKEFLPFNYKELILLTTQDFSKSSTVKGWNNKTAGEKENTLKAIEKKYKKQEKKDANKEKLVSNVLSESNADKLKIILDKFVILDSSPKDIEYWNTIKDTKAGHIPNGNRNDYMNSLLGFIIAPETIEDKSGWFISYNDFTAKIQSLSEQYNAVTKIFPQINRNISDTEISDKDQHLFVKKIDDINYDEIKNKAISDYIKTNHTILEDLRKYAVPKNIYDSYEENITDFYEPKFRHAQRNINNKEEIEKESKDFYDDVTGSSVQQFSNFNNTPLYFRNGTLHNLADDENKNIKWKLDNGDKNE